MKSAIKIGDLVIHIEDKVIGEVIKRYHPTACAEQTMVKTEDGRCYHAPTAEWRHLEAWDYCQPAAADAAIYAAAPIMVKHNYRDVKIGENTTITIDLEDFNKQLQRELYKDLDIFRGLNYGA